MNDKTNIDELLTCFLDGELSQRQQTEVKRLIEHDEHIADRLRQLEKCRTVVGALPVEQAPAGIVEQIGIKLRERETLQRDHDEDEHREGEQYLLRRQVLSAAAIILLAAVLAIVVYNIIAPQEETKREYVIEQTEKEDLKAIVEKPETEVTERTEVAVEAKNHDVSPLINDKEIRARIELTTKDLLTVDAFISRAAEDNDMVEYNVPRDMGREGFYSLKCNKESLNLFFANLQSIWPKFDTVVLYLESEGDDENIVVHNATAEQIVKITEQENFNESVRLARDFEILNRIERQLPADDALAVVEGAGTDLIAIPKPVLTSNDKKVTKPADVKDEQQFVYLTIVVSFEQ